MSDNRIQVENRLPGTTSWQLSQPAPGLADDGAARRFRTAVEGYASLSSVAPGGTIDLHVSTTSHSVQAQVFRMGWYAGTGGRLMTSLVR